MLEFFIAEESHIKEFETTMEEFTANDDIYRENKKLKFFMQQLEMNRGNGMQIGNISEELENKKYYITSEINSISLELLRNYNVKLVCGMVRNENIIDSDTVNIQKKVIIDRIEKLTADCFDYNAERRMIGRIHCSANIGDTIGEAVEIKAFNISCGLGNLSCDRKNDYLAAGSSNISGNIIPYRYNESDFCTIPIVGVVCENDMYIDTTKLFSDILTGVSAGNIKNCNFNSDNWKNGR